MGCEDLKGKYEQLCKEKRYYENIIIFYSLAPYQLTINWLQYIYSGLFEEIQNI